MFVDGGVGPSPKVLEAYMSKSVWPSNLPEAELHDLHMHYLNMGDGCLV